MGHRGGLKELQAGHYYATVDGVLYVMRRARQEVPPRVVWDLYQVVEGDEEFLERAATLGCHRRTLDALVGGAGEARPPCRAPAR